MKAPPLFLILVLFLCQDANATKHGQRDIKEEVQQYFEKMSRIIVDRINTSRMQFLDEFRNYLLNDVYENTVKKTSEKIGYLMVHANERIQELSELASEFGIQISPCTANAREQFQKVATDTMADLNSCLNQYTPYINNVGKLLESYYELVVNRLRNEILKCQDNAICLTKVAGLIMDATLRTPLDIYETASDFADYLFKMQSDYSICSTTGVTHFIEEHKGIMKSINYCVGNKTLNYY